MSDALIRIGFFTDLHLSGKTPASRQDDFTQTTLDKLAFCLKRCADENCDLIIFGGDFTHSHKLTNDSLKERVIDVMCENLPEDLPFFYTYGQHDLYGESLESKDESTTAFIMRMLNRMGRKTFEISHKAWGIQKFLREGKMIDIALSACSRGVEPTAWFERMNVCAPTDTTNIAVVHHLVSDQDAPWLVNYKTLTTGETERKIDVVLSGDLHCGCGPVLNELGTLFFNPGSLARTMKSKREVDRVIKGADIVVHSGDEGVFCEAQGWPVTIAKPSSAVFRPDAPLVDEDALEFTEEDEQLSADFDSVIKRLSEMKVKKIDVWELLERRAKEANLAPDVLAYLMRRRPTT